MYIDDVIEANPARSSVGVLGLPIKDMIRIDIMEESHKVLGKGEGFHDNVMNGDSRIRGDGEDVYKMVVEDHAARLSHAALIFPESRMIYRNFGLNYSDKAWIRVSYADLGEDHSALYMATHYIKTEMIGEWSFILDKQTGIAPIEDIHVHGLRVDDVDKIWRIYTEADSLAYYQGHLDKKYKIDTTLGIRTGEFDSVDDVTKNYTEVAIALTALIMKTMSIINCKNIEIEEEEPNPKLQKSRKKKGRLPLLSRHRVMIIPSAGQRKKGHAPQELWENRAHTVRGHFKTFTDEAPLLGKITGTFWWSPFARGSVTEGVIEKEYELEVSA
jgi:hypothetical protein